MFVPGKLFEPCLMFVDKASLPKGVVHETNVLHSGRFYKPANIRQIG